jgi:cytochrome c553
MRKVFIYSLNLILLAFSGFASASEGDAAAGKLKVYTCTGCHGIEGYRNAYPNYRVPKINGQNREYITAALNAYKAGERQHPTMRAQGESLTEQDIADIAAYLSEAHTSGSP